VVEARKNLGGGKKETLARLAELNNIISNTKLIAQSELISNLIKQQKFSVVEALYDLKTGKVSLDLEAQKSQLIETHRPKAFNYFSESKIFSPQSSN
ncbi:MAG: hypothetical protein ABIQ95_17325, partial [Bdellovibrionia bacterium]